MLISVHEMTRAGRRREAGKRWGANQPRRQGGRRATGTVLDMYARPAPQCG